MSTKIAAILLLANIFLVTLMPLSLHAEEMPWWDDNWSYRFELVIPFDTSDPHTKYQPIDTLIEFNNPCWAKNEQEHSIRLIFQFKDHFIELESQIYDLNYLDNQQIQSCSIVFLIPQEANGNEIYYVYYDESEKKSPNYVDHLDIEESYYRYEPISGYPLTSSYYKIIQDGYIPYAISYEGELMGYYTAQHVTKLKDNITEVLPKNGELFAAFNFEYYFGQEMCDFSTTGQCLVSKEITVNGNLMVEFGIISTNKREDVRTTAIYKYYYCPSENKRIHVHVIHEALKELNVAEGVNTDGIFALIQSGGISSSTIKDLNIGEIMPYLHTYTEYNTIEEYPMDLDPDYIPEDPDIRVLSTEDDVDIGEKSWACFDYGDVGVAHAIIFSSNQVLKSGTNERDGIQIKAYEMDYPHLPGIENDMATVNFGRNSYESGDIHDLLIPDDFVVEFDAEFFSSKKGGFKIVAKETEIFQKLVEIKPKYESEIDDEVLEIEKYDLTVFAHFSNSFPMGSTFSALLGRNFSYISAELYKDDEFVFSGAMGRLLLKPLPDMSEEGKIRQLITILSSFDYRNFTFIKKFIFKDLSPGRYIIKIFKENQFLGSEKKYVGYQIIEINEDKKTRIFCRPQGKIKVTVVDQFEKVVSDAKVNLLSDEVIISQIITDENGEAIITAPCQFLKNYDIEVMYNGISVFKDKIRLSFRNCIFPIKTLIDIKRYNFSINVFDTWNLISEIKLTPKLICNLTNKQTIIFSDNQINGQYKFKNIPPEKYQLSLQYKSFNLNLDVSIPCDDVDIIFPAEFKININTMDSRGIANSDGNIILSRIGKQIKQNNSKSAVTFLLPPGTYNAKIYEENNLIGCRNIAVFSERSFDIITTKEPLMPFIMTIISVVIAFFGLLLSYIKKDIFIFLKVLVVSLIVIAIFSPWWMLNGSNADVQTSSTMYLTPINLVTITSTTDISSGELAFLPQLFIDALSLILLISTISVLFIISSIFLREKGKRLNLIFLIITIILCIITIFIFSFAMNELTEVGIGSFIGEETLEINIPGEEFTKSVVCSWGPSNGYYLFIIVIIILFLIILYNVKNMSKIKE